MLRIKVYYVFPSCFIIFICYISLVVLVSLLGPVNGDRNQCKRGQPYEKVILALQWPPGVCFKNAAKTCIVNQDRFLIHGSWPSNGVGPSPEFCCNERFDPEQLNLLEPQLQDKWKTIFAGSGNDQSFWRHEWSKHGTCASASSPAMSGLALYFRETLSLYDRSPLLDWLSKDNIKPGQSFPVKDIHSAIEKHTRKRVYIECKRVSRQDSPDPIVTGIRLCFRPESLDFTDCQYRDDTDCGTKNVRFLSSKNNASDLKTLNWIIMPMIVLLILIPFKIAF